MLASPQSDDKTELLPSSSTTSPNVNEHAVSSTFISASTWAQEMKLVFCIFYKIALANVFELTPQVLSNIFIGHLSLPNANSSILLSGCGLSSTFLNVTGLSVAWGFTSALYTLIPQCLGANQHQLLTIYFQRAVFILSTVLIFSTILQFFAGSIMRVIFINNNPNPVLYDIITEYCRWLIPWLYFLVWLTICQRVAQSLRLNSQLLYIVLIGAILTIPLNYFFVYYLNLNYIGTAFTINVTALCSFLLIVCMLCYKNYSFLFYPVQSFKIICNWNGIKEYLSLAIPGLVQSSLGFWMSELVTILSGCIITNPSIAISATVICNNLNIPITMISVAMQNALNIRLGKYIGAGSIYKAKRLIWCAFAMDIMFMFIIIILLYVFNKEIIEIWTNDEEIFNVASKLVVVGVIPRCLGFNVYMCLCAIFRGLGYPTSIAVIIFVSQYLVALPIEIILLFGVGYIQYTSYGLYVIWLCASLGYIFACIVITLFLIFKIDFKAAVQDSQSRINQSLKIMKHYGSVDNNDDKTAH